jgi:hypothetical protein
MNHTVLFTATAIAGVLILALVTRGAAGRRHRAPGAPVDAISYHHLLTLALIWSSRPGVLADQGSPGRGHVCDGVVVVSSVIDRLDGRPAAGLARPVTSAPAPWSPARLAYWFYAVAAAGAVIGQTWVAVTHVPWSPGVPVAVRVAAVLPFALCLELLAMALAAMADERMRLGEHAYGFRMFSAVVATVAVGILVAGHWPHLYWSAGFGLLSCSAYLLWLLHSAARRRDALRAAGKLADTASDYGGVAAAAAPGLDRPGRGVGPGGPGRRRRPVAAVGAV